MIEPLLLSSSHRLSTVYKRFLKCVCNAFIYIYVCKHFSRYNSTAIQALREKIFFFCFGWGGGGGGGGTFRRGLGRENIRKLKLKKRRDGTRPPRYNKYNHKNVISIFQMRLGKVQYPIGRCRH